MKTYLGKTDLNKSWQADFPKTVKCHKCKGEARIMFVGFEKPTGQISQEELICDLRENNGKGDYWVHDCCAVAVYLCKKCFEPNALINQA